MLLGLYLSPPDCLMVLFPRTCYKFVVVARVLCPRLKKSQQAVLFVVLLGLFLLVYVFSSGNIFGVILRCLENEMMN